MVQITCPHCNDVLLILEKPMSGTISCQSCTWEGDIELAYQGIYFIDHDGKRVNLSCMKSNTSGQGLWGRIRSLFRKNRKALWAKKIQVIKLGTLDRPTEKEAHRAIEELLKRAEPDEVLLSAKDLIESTGTIPMLGLCGTKASEEDRSVSFFVERTSPHATEIQGYTVRVDQTNYRVFICLYNAWSSPN